MNGSAVLSCYKILHVAIYAAYGNFAGIYPGKLPVFFFHKKLPCFVNASGRAAEFAFRVKDPHPGILIQEIAVICRKQGREIPGFPKFIISLFEMLHDGQKQGGTGDPFPFFQGKDVAVALISSGKSI